MRIKIPTHTLWSTGSIQAYLEGCADSGQELKGCTVEISFAQLRHSPDDALHAILHKMEVGELAVKIAA